MQPIECVAAIAWEAEKPLDVTIIIVDPPKKGEVRIRVSAHSHHCNLTHPVKCSSLKKLIRYAKGMCFIESLAEVYG